MKRKKYIFIIVILLFLVIILSIIAINLARQTPKEVTPLRPQSSDIAEEFIKYKIKPREARYYE